MTGSFLCVDLPLHRAGDEAVLDLLGQEHVDQQGRDGGDGQRRADGTQSVVYWPERACTPTGRVFRLSLLMNTLANISSFQHCRNV